MKQTFRLLPPTNDLAKYAVIYWLIFSGSTLVFALMGVILLSIGVTVTVTFIAALTSSTIIMLSAHIAWFVALRGSHTLSNRAVFTRAILRRLVNLAIRASIIFRSQFLIPKRWRTIDWEFLTRHRWRNLELNDANEEELTTIAFNSLMYEPVFGSARETAMLQTVTIYYITHRNFVKPFKNDKLLSFILPRLELAAKKIHNNLERQSVLSIVFLVLGALTIAVSGLLAIFTRQYLWVAGLFLGVSMEYFASVLLHNVRRKWKQSEIVEFLMKVSTLPYDITEDDPNQMEDDQDVMSEIFMTGLRNIK